MTNMEKYLGAREALEMASKIGVTEEIWERLWDTEVQAWIYYGVPELKEKLNENK